MKETKKKTSAKSKTSKASSKKVSAKKEVKSVKVEPVQKIEKVKTVKTIKTADKTNIIKWTRLGAFGLALVLFVLGFFLTEESTILHFSGIFIAAITCITYTVNSEKYSLLKSLGVLLLSAILITWFVPNGAFSGAEFTSYEITGLSLTDISTLFYYSVYFSLDKIIFLFTIAIFYGVLSKVKAYEVITSKIAKKLVNKKLVVAISSIAIFTILTVLFNQTLMVIFFVPFVITILSKMKIDKVTALMITFGAVLSGIIGAPWGTEGLNFFTQYTQIPFTSGFEYRVIIALASLALFILFTVLRLKSIKNSENLETVEDPFVIEDNTEKVNIIPMSIILGLTAVIAILGFINWQLYFEITVFNDFHTWLLELMVGETAVFAKILGSSAVAFGSWDLLLGMVLLIVMTILIAISARISFDKVMEGIVKGLKVFAKPSVLIIVIFITFIVSYITPFMTAISDYFFTLTVEFNPNFTSIAALLSGIFHPDFGYTGYVIGSYISVMYVDQLSLVSTIFSSMYGIAQVIAPTSLVLILGLVYTKVSYKEWIKTIWMFIVGITIVILVLSNVLYYIA